MSSEPEDNLDPTEGGDGNDPVGALEADLRKLHEERTTLFQQLARVQADFRNARQRLESDKQQQIQYANTTFLKGLLPVLDSFERALEVDPATTDFTSVLKGMQIVHDQLVKVLEANSVRVIAPEPGTPFDPHQHEALMQQPGGQSAEPVVAQLLQKGYAMHDRVIRPAQVVVSKAE
jgi:molecular chaperone GrpE